MRASTVFDASLVGGLAALRSGDVVEVCGQFDALAKRYVASRIEPRPDAARFRFKLRGRVTARDPTARTLVIGGQTIDHSGANPLPALAIGQILRVLRQSSVGRRHLGCPCD